MSNSIITDAGAALIAACQANEEVLVIDKMIFADVPDLDTGVMPPAGTVLPPAGQIKLQADIAQAGLVNSNTIVYSVTLGATAGPFYINWIGLYSSAHNTLVAVCYVPRHYKFATDGFRTGNTLYKNFALQVTNVSDLTGVIISAGTWQQDLTAILANYALAHTHPYEPIGAVAAHNESATPHPGKFESAGAVAGHAAASNPHAIYARIVNDFVNNKGVNGYTYLPNGLIIQWGLVSATDTLTAHNYPIAFPAAALAISSSTYSDGDGSRACGCALFTSTQFYAHKDSSAASDITWIAIGY